MLKTRISHNKRLIYLIAIGCFVWMHTSAQNPLLEGYIKEALEKNPLLGEKKMSYLSQQQLENTKGFYQEPKLSLQFLPLPIETRLGSQVFRFQLEQKFPWFGTLKLEKEYGKQQSERVENSLKKTQLDLVHKVRKIYFQLYYLKAKSDIIKKKIKILDQWEAYLNIQLSNAAILLKDKMLWMLKKSEWKEDYQDVLAMLKIKKIAMKTLLARSNHSSIVVPDSVSPLPIEDENIADQMAHHVNVQAIDIESRMIAKEMQLTRKKNHQHFALGIDYLVHSKNNLSVKNAGTDAIVLPKIAYVLPIRNKKYKAFLAALAYSQEMMDEKKKKTFLNLEYIYNKNQTDLINLKRKQKFILQQIKNIKKIKELVEEDIKNNLLNIDEIFQVEEQYLNYLIELETINMKINITSSNLLFLTEKL